MNKKGCLSATVLVAVLAGGRAVQAAPADYPVPTGYVAQTYTSGDSTLNYNLLTPPSAATRPPQGWPLVLVLHGDDSKGAAMLGLGTKRLADEKGTFPCYVMAPVCPTGTAWTVLQNGLTGPNTYVETPTEIMQLVIAAVTALRNDSSKQIDAKRIYLMGFGKGGYAVWDLAVRRPDLWAAVVAAGGGGDSSKAAAAKDLAIWASANNKPGYIPAARTEEMIAAVKAAGGAPLYTRYCHDRDLDLFNETELLRWMWLQNRGLAPVSFPAAMASYGRGNAQPPSNFCPGEGFLQPLWLRDDFRTKRDLYKANPAAHQGSIVFIGDSITEMWAPRFGTDFPGMTIKGLGIAGDLSRGVLYRIEDAVALNPSAVSILVGINDFSFGVEDWSTKNVIGIVSRNIQAMVTRLHQHNPEMPVVVNTVFPKGITMIPELNSALKAAFAADPKVTICDSFEVFEKKDASGAGLNVPKDGYTTDGVHPSDLGYAEWAKVLKPVLENLLNPPVPGQFTVNPAAAGNVGWNDTVWGDPAAAPVPGNDYVHDGSTTAVLLGLGATYGPFAGDSLTLGSGSVMYVKGGGPLGGVLKLNGGQVQARIAGTPVVSGHVEIVSDSRILVIGGNLQLDAGISSSSNAVLTLGNYNLSGKSMVINGADEGFSGTFYVADTGIAEVDYTWNIRFGKSYTNATLVIAGNRNDPADAAIYQLIGHVAFRRVQMTDGSGGLVDLLPGVYDGAALRAAGVSDRWFNDLGGTLRVGSGAFTTWAAEWNAGIGGLLDDFDGDGVNNLCEYALGGNPSDPADRGWSPELVFRDGQLDVVCLRRDDPGLIWSFEMTENLESGSWSNAAGSVTGSEPAGAGYVRVTSRIPAPDSKAFVRVKVHHP